MVIAWSVDLMWTPGHEIASIDPVINQLLPPGTIPKVSFVRMDKTASGPFDWTRQWTGYSVTGLREV